MMDSVDQGRAEDETCSGTDPLRSPASLAIGLTATPRRVSIITVNKVSAFSCLVRLELDELLRAKGVGMRKPGGRTDFSFGAAEIPSVVFVGERNRD